MALPARLRHLDGLVDLLVDQLLEDVEAEMAGSQNEDAPGVTTSEGANQLQRHEHSPGGRSVVDHSRIPAPST